MSTKTTAEQLEDFADSIVGYVNYDRLALWKEVLFHPDKTFKEELGKGSYMRAAKDVFVSAIPLNLFYGLIVLLYIGLFGIVLLPSLFMVGSGVGIGGLAGFVLLIFLFILAFVMYLFYPVFLLFINSAALFVIARIFGGRGNLKDHIYLSALVNSGSYLIVLASLLISLIPCIGSILGIPAIIYMLYLKYKALMVIHDYSGTKSMATLAVSMLISIGMMVGSYFAMIFLAGLSAAV
jgi:hypothetical protein